MLTSDEKHNKRRWNDDSDKQEQGHDEPEEMREPKASSTTEPTHLHRTRKEHGVTHAQHMIQYRV